MESLRLFVAVALPQEIRAGLAEQARALQKRLSGPTQRAVRWSAADKLHLTLRFLGDTPAGKVNGLSAALRAEVRAYPPCVLEIGGLGAFPTLRRPRVVWVGVRADAQLLRLQKGLEAAVVALGFAPEPRPFSPHLTLARIAPEASAAALAEISQTLGNLPPLGLGSLTVTQVHLYRSDLRPEGAVYTVLGNMKLVGLTGA